MPFPLQLGVPCLIAFWLVTPHFLTHFSTKPPVFGFTNSLFLYRTIMYLFSLKRHLTIRRPDRCWLLYVAPNLDFNHALLIRSKPYLTSQQLLFLVRWSPHWAGTEVKLLQSCIGHGSWYPQYWQSGNGTRREAIWQERELLSVPEECQILNAKSSVIERLSFMRQDRSIYIFIEGSSQQIQRCSFLMTGTGGLPTVGGHWFATYNVTNNFRYRPVTRPLQPWTRVCGSKPALHR